ncbi:MAG: hypothetical protein CVT49_11300 [candidate division Zixibacteria bacterium HGW-Zixibacteria-1]|nr:MAG: hypothetical protein CVT49_11300 [candidate division Zixibacteria bacterium HGW-Zixibacteria-1]
MSQFILDFFFAFIFVTLTILLMRIKDRAFVENKESYRYAASGIIVLFLVSVMRLLSHQQVFVGIPFLSEPVCQDLIEVIGIVAGMTLMLAGVSIWLPIKKRRTGELEAEILRNSSVQKIEWEIKSADKISRLFETVPAQICDKFGFVGSAVFMKRSDTDYFACRYTHNTEFAVFGRRFYQSGSDNDCDILNRAAKILKADYCFPLQINNKMRATIFFRGEKNFKPESDDILALDRIGRSFSERLNREYLSLKQSFYENNWLYLSQVKRLIARRIDIKGSLHDLSSLYRHAVGAEYFSLAVLDKSRHNMRRYTSGINRRILLEDGVRLPIEGTQIATVINSRQSMLVRDVTRSGNTGLDSLLLSCGQASVMVVPIINYGRVIGCLTLGHSRPGHFTRRALLRTEMMAAAMAPAVESAVLRTSIFERDRYLGALSAFDTIIENSSDINSVLTAAADLLMDNIRTTLVRISMIDPDRARLHTKALKLIRPFDAINSNTVNLSREMTPWHHLVVREGRLLLINQTDPETSFDENESRNLVFTGANSALIVPITVNGITQGLITLGEMRNWNRFSYDSTVIMFARQIAARVASFIKLYRISRLLTRAGKTPVEGPGEQDERHILDEIKSPLTRLRGSLDLLRIHEGAMNSGSDKVFATIEESADQIATLLKGEAK